ncbi:MAG: AzlC family ABC transporter permease [Anaerolineales bacterium]|nr:AzlC family ABC transporter permease [Anaerolineales bacterium]
MPPTPSDRKQHFLAGARDTFPLLVGAWPFGLIYGALGIASGLSPLATAAMSAVVFAGSAQFIAVSLVAAGTPVLVIALTTFVVNARHILYAATLAPQLKGLSTRWLAPLGFWLTDESFVVAAKGFEARTTPHERKWYLLGSELAMFLNWQIATWVGIAAGQAIPDPASWGLEFALVVTFLGMLVPMLKGRPELISVLVAAATALLAVNLPHRSGLLLAAVLGILAGLLAEQAWPRKEPA